MRTERRLPAKRATCRIFLAATSFPPPLWPRLNSALPSTKFRQARQLGAAVPRP